MKCDELKDYDYDPDFPFQSRGRFYVADEVEAAIDELKAEHHKKRHEYIKMIAELEESHRKEVEQLLMKIAGLEKLVETADKLLKPKGGFTIKDITFNGVKLEGVKND